MTGNNAVDRDERTVVVENSSYSLGYKIVVYALLIDVAYRAFALNQASWDLLAIVIISGLALTAYQARHHILTRTWVQVAALAIVIAAVIGIVVATLR